MCHFFWSIVPIALLIVLIVHFLEGMLLQIGNSLEVQSRIQANRIFTFPADKRVQDWQTVVLIGERTLQHNRWEWPVHYRNHAKALRAIRDLKPFAVMVDFLFLDYRDGEGLQALISEFRAYDAAGIHLLIAAPPYDDNVDQYSQVEILGEIVLGLPDPGNVSLVPVSLYQPKQDAAKYVSGGGWGTALRYPAKGKTSDGETRASAAFALAKLARTSHPEISQLTSTKFAKKEGFFPFDNVEVEKRNDLEVFWWNTPRLEYENNRCQDSQINTMADSQLGRAVLAPFSQEELSLACLGMMTLQASDLTADNRTMWEIADLTGVESVSSLKGEIEGKMVFYGQSLLATEDLVRSPVHGIMPAIYMHAMAFNNLLDGYGRYVNARDEESWSYRLSWLVELGVAVVFLSIFSAVSRILTAPRLKIYAFVREGRFTKHFPGSFSQVVFAIYCVLTILLLVAGCYVLLLYCEYVAIKGFFGAGFNRIKILTMVGLVFFVELLHIGKEFEGILERYCGYNT